jgi:hypothetical protein
VSDLGLIRDEQHVLNNVCFGLVLGGEHQTIMNQRQLDNDSDGDTDITWKVYKSMSFTSQVADSMSSMFLGDMNRKCVSAT